MPLLAAVLTAFVSASASAQEGVRIENPGKRVIVVPVASPNDDGVRQPLEPMPEGAKKRKRRKTQKKRGLGPGLRGLDKTPQAGLAPVKPKDRASKQLPRRPKKQICEIHDCEEVGGGGLPRLKVRSKTEDPAMVEDAAMAEIAVNRTMETSGRVMGKAADKMVEGMKRSAERAASTQENASERIKNARRKAREKRARFKAKDRAHPKLNKIKRR